MAIDQRYQNRTVYAMQLYNCRTKNANEQHANRPLCEMQREKKNKIVKQKQGNF